MENENEPALDPYPIGGKVVLQADPEGPVMTIKDIRTDGTVFLYTVMGSDKSNQRFEAEYTGSELLVIER